MWHFRKEMCVRYPRLLWACSSFSPGTSFRRYSGIAGARHNDDDLCPPIPSVYRRAPYYLYM